MCFDSLGITTPASVNGYQLSLLDVELLIFPYCPFVEAVLTKPLTGRFAWFERDNVSHD